MRDGFDLIDDVGCGGQQCAGTWASSVEKDVSDDL